MEEQYFEARFYLNILKSILSCLGLKFSDGFFIKQYGESYSDGVKGTQIIQDDSLCITGILN